MKLLTALVVTLLVVSRAEAATFQLEFEGKPLAGGEVCFFDAISALDPVPRLTTFTKVICSPANENVVIPRGTWNVFARLGDKYVSPRLLLARDGQVEGNQRVIAVTRAVRLNFDGALGDSETAAIYVETTGAVLPLAPGETTLLAPSGSTVVPLFMKERSLTRFGSSRKAELGALPITRPVDVEGRRDVAVGLVPDSRAFERIPTQQRSAGNVEWMAGDGSHSLPQNRLDPAFKGTTALALFKSVSGEDARVKLTGRGWIADDVIVKSFRPERALRVAPSTTLTVQWSVVDDVARIAEQVRHPDCPARLESTSSSDIPALGSGGLLLTLARCPDLQLAMSTLSVRKNTCSSVASATLDPAAMSGFQTWNDVARGNYLLRLGYGDLPPSFAILEVDGADSKGNIQLRFDKWFGRVTLDGKPLHARIDVGSGTVSDPDTGEYFTVSTPVPPPPADAAHRMFKDAAPIAIVACNSEVETMFFPDETPVPNVSFDIDVVTNSVTVHTRDSRTGTPVANANVEYRVLAKEDPNRSLLGGVIGTTDIDGQFTLQAVPGNRKIVLCASRTDYRRACADAFLMKAERTRRVAITLEEVQTRQGVVRNPQAAGGTVEWYGSDGRSTETALLAADATFSYTKPHAPGEIVTVTSAGTPLLIFRMPALPDGEIFAITFPSAPIAGFRVTLSDRTRDMKGFFSLSIGDTMVPLGVLSRHLRPRGTRPLFLSPGAVNVPDILMTGRVVFTYAPIPWLEIHAKDQSIDFFYLTEAASLPRVVPKPNGEVVLGE